MQTMDSIHIATPESLAVPKNTKPASAFTSLRLNRANMIETDLTDKQETLYLEIESQLRDSDHPIVNLINLFQ